MENVINFHLLSRWRDHSHTIVHWYAAVLTIIIIIRNENNYFVVI